MMSPSHAFSPSILVAYNLAQTIQVNSSDRSATQGNHQLNATVQGRKFQVETQPWKTQLSYTTSTHCNHTCNTYNNSNAQQQSSCEQVATNANKYIKTFMETLNTQSSYIMPKKHCIPTKQTTISNFVSLTLTLQTFQTWHLSSLIHHTSKS